MTAITAAIRADAATSDAEGRRDLAGHLADFRAALLDEAALIAAADRSRFDSEVATLTATRDIVIGQRETAQRERDEARGLLHALTADLNATREKLATAEAFRDSLQAEVDRVSAEHTAAIAREDNAVSEAERMERERDHARRDRNELAARYVTVETERDALRAEADKLRARPVVTEAALRLAITSRRTGEDGPRIGTPASIYAQLTEGGAVTLPSQDRAEELARAVNHGGGWPITTYAMSSALASLGAPATTPSKPADVFAGVSIEELDKVQMTAEVEYAIKVGSYSDSTPACRAAGLSAVLDALRAKLVAPVDPDAVLADVFGAPHWRSFANEYRTARCVAMRATLTAKGIPVTPEAGK